MLPDEPYPLRVILRADTVLGNVNGFAVDRHLSLPDDLIIRNGWNKLILRHALADILPPKVAHRRLKVGFFTPETKWMQEIHRQAEEIICSHSGRDQRYFSADSVIAAFRRGYRGVVLQALNLEMWLRVFFDGAPSGQHPVLEKQ